MANREFCCERCKAAPEKTGYDGGIDQESAAALRIAEVQTNFGILWVMCIDCRKEWVKHLNNSETMKEYSRNGFRLEHWRIAHRKTGKEDVEVGLKLVDKLNELDAKLYEEALEWMDKGKPKPAPKVRVRRDEDEFGGDDYGDGGSND